VRPSIADFDGREGKYERSGGARQSRGIWEGWGYKGHRLASGALYNLSERHPKDQLRKTATATVSPVPALSGFSRRAAIERRAGWSDKTQRRGFASDISVLWNIGGCFWPI
jgi:hypothetical protein